MIPRPIAWLAALAAVALHGHAARADRGAIRDRDGSLLAETRGGARLYPRGQHAAHVVSGVEKALDSELRAGEDVVLTVDLHLQKLAEKAVRGHRAAAVAVVEVETGRLLALVSRPSFDPNAMTGGAELARLARDPARPLIDRTLEKTYRPASTFKLVTAVAALENGLVRPDEEMTCSGTRVIGDHVLHDMEVHGTIDLLEALQRSCNVYFWALAERAGIDRLAQVARDFGFGARTGLGINGDLAGQVPDQRLLTGDGNGDLELTLNTAVGLGEVRVTVVQLAMAYAALANGGRLWVPQVVRGIERAGGVVVADRPPVLRRRVAVSPATVDIIRRGMTRAVNTRGGTAFTARRGAVKMVGKTGTFEPPDRDAADALFAGWAPSDRPQIAVVVLIEGGGIGGEVAAPVARDVIDGYFTRHARHKATPHHARKKVAEKKAAEKKAAEKKAAKKKGRREARAAGGGKRRPR